MKSMTIFQKGKDISEKEFRDDLHVQKSTAYAINLSMARLQSEGCWRQTILMTFRYRRYRIVHVTDVMWVNLF